MNTTVDGYLAEGCGRCAYYATPKCKVKNWQKELQALRQVVLDCGLVEELKWGVPCYTFEGKNVVIVSAFKDYCCLSFFKGSLLDDPHGMLVKQGENSQAARLIKFKKIEEIEGHEKIIKTYIEKAIEIEKSGLKVKFSHNPEPIPDELNDKFEEMPALKQAFHALPLGKQRGYLIHFAQAKQSQTRKNRIEKYVQKILNGKGFND